MTARAVRVRPATRDDDVAVLDLLGSALDDEGGHDRTGLAHVLFGDLAPHDTGEGGLGVVAESDERIVGAAYGVVGSRDGATLGWLRVVAVDPGERRAGIGRALVEGFETAVAQRGASVAVAGGSAPTYWWPGVDEADPDALAFFDACGYDREGACEALNLDVDLVAHRDLVTADEPQDDASTCVRLDAALWPQLERWLGETWGPGWATEVHGALARDPVSCVVALDGDVVVAFAAYDTNRAGWFGPMGTGDAARGRGLGAALLRACLRDYLDAGRERCEIGWVGPVDFYARTVGAVPGRRFVALRKRLSAARRDSR